MVQVCSDKISAAIRSLVLWRVEGTLWGTGGAWAAGVVGTYVLKVQVFKSAAMRSLVLWRGESILRGTGDAWAVGVVGTYVLKVHV
jgi:hypothetical protein